MISLGAAARSGLLASAKACISSAVALAWGALRVEAGTLELRTLLIVLLLGVEVFRPLRDMTVLYHQGMVATAAAQGIFALLDSQPAVIAPAASAASMQLQLKQCAKKPGRWCATLTSCTRR